MTEPEKWELMVYYCRQLSRLPVGLLDFAPGSDDWQPDSLTASAAQGRGWKDHGGSLQPHGNSGSRGQLRSQTSLLFKKRSFKLGTLSRFSMKPAKQAKIAT